MASAPSRISAIAPFEREDIKQALETAPKLQEADLSSVAKLSDTLVVKYGWGIRHWEARNMMLAASIPGVRVPKVYDAWEEEDRSRGEDDVRTKGYIVMDYISGTTLWSAWLSMDSEARASIYEQLARIITALHSRELTAPGPVGGGPSRGFYFTQYDVGPFETAHAMEEWFNERQQVSKDFGRVYEDEPDFSGTFNQLVMCHMDLHMANMILDSDKNIWLVDWASAGGYPVYFEEAQLERGVGEPGDAEYREGLLKMLSNPAHDRDIKRLKGLGFAVTTGWRLKPRGPQTE